MHVLERTAAMEQSSGEDAATPGLPAAEAVLAAAPDGVFSFDHDLRLTSWNPAMERFTGIGRAEALGRPIFELLPALRRSGEDRFLLAALAGADSAAEATAFTPPESSHALNFEAAYAPLRAADGAVVGGVAVLRDVTHRGVQEGLLAQQAFYDSVTGLPSQALFLDRLAHALARRTGGLAVLLLDLEGLQGVNERFGHAAGDALLRLVGVHLADCVRPGDTVARFSADRFAVLVEEIGRPADARLVAERVLAALARPLPLPLPGEASLLRGSIGIALSMAPHAPALPDELVQEADLALHRAGQTEKERVVISTPWRQRRGIESANPG